MVLASCCNKYYGTNFIYAVPTSPLIAPGLRTIQFMFSLGIYQPTSSTGVFSGLELILAAFGSVEPG
jgi:hypothetical protein